MKVKSKIFETITIGEHRLKNRIVMAPMTRSRAETNGVPTDIMSAYYSQRASAGLIISEATQISLNGKSYPNTPGIYSKQQIKGWKKVTDGVHEAGGKIFIQLFHGGRISHPDTQGGKIPMAPSEIKPEGAIHTFPFGKKKQFITPRAIESTEIKEIVHQFGVAAKNALDAGFDGIEIHAANGYLIDQFLRDSTNKRTDAYGGSYQNRSRILLEIIQETGKYFNLQHIGVRLSPLNNFNDISDSNPLGLYSYLLEELNSFKLAYVHFVEDGLTSKNLDFFNGVSLTLGKYYNGKVMGNGNYTFERADSEILEGVVDFVSFGKLFISNPDLPKRFMLETEFNIPDENSYYSGGKRGYIDYESLEG
ncbi:N-ethylmaleimide reductase [Maribacter dokdonensis]|uniref:N-ethylmaleimide reductase n=1 Tax=Maribacter dokdonensis TaxID=320912 RepID=A0ABY0UMH8_9FLAO|nr:alkene reductase [Maribacter dokdonensis]SDS91864.1 N-ethylmaleimide reductase [Maribacter dokdonensis]